MDRADAARWTRVKDVFHEALDTPPESRGGFLVSACGTDTSLRLEIESLLASDAVNDVQPSGVAGVNRPVHQLTQVNMGLPIVDNAYTEDAAAEAARLKRWHFMFTLHIFQIKGGTAGPFNALATF